MSESRRYRFMIQVRTKSVFHNPLFVTLNLFTRTGAYGQGLIMQMLKRIQHDPVKGENGYTSVASSFILEVVPLAVRHKWRYSTPKISLEDGLVMKYALSSIPATKPGFFQNYYQRQRNKTAVKITPIIYINKVLGTI